MFGSNALADMMIKIDIDSLLSPVSRPLYKLSGIRTNLWCCGQYPICESNTFVRSFVRDLGWSLATRSALPTSA
jgi:hypothetical protein